MAWTRRRSKRSAPSRLRLFEPTSWCGPNLADSPNKEDSMRIRTTITNLSAFAAAALLATACSEAPTAPKADAVGTPLFATNAPISSGIALDQFNGTLASSGRLLVKGFNPTNPHRGDAIVATFFWVGPPNIIDSVADVLTTAPVYTPVGNRYTLVESATANGYSMATYVATNVQNFPDPNTDQGQVLAVAAYLSQPVIDGGLTLSAWTGVNVVAGNALGAHRSASGSASGGSLVGPGSIPIGAGALAYGVTISNALAGRDPPFGFTRIGAGSDAFMVTEGDYALQAAIGTVDPQWFWAFPASPPSTWLTSVIALNPPLHLAFSVQPSRTLPLMAIQPAVQVTALNAEDNPVTSFNGPVTIAIGRNGSINPLMPGTLSGTTTVSAVNGVATFSNLSIDQLGNGYTLVVSASSVFGAESSPFNIGAM